MQKVILSLFTLIIMVLAVPSEGEARGFGNSSWEEKRLERTIRGLEKAILKMEARLEKLRNRLCEIQNCNEAEPEPEGGILITEVLFNPGPTEVQGTDLDNEWVEIYNGTDREVDLNGWSIGDGTGMDILSSGEFILGSGRHAVITRSASTDTFWTYGPETLVIHLDSPIGSGGLTNTGESVRLYDAAGEEIDAVGWGTDTSVLNPSVDISNILEGQSIAREDYGADTDTALEWQIQETPTPGS